MIDDEPLDDRDEENSNYDTTDPEGPGVRHSPEIPSDPLATRRSYLDILFNQLHVGREYIGASYIWHNVLWNRGFWNFAATIAIAVATVLYTHYSRKQLRAINDQLPELHSSAEAAKSAAKTAKDTLGDSAKEFRIEERPYSVVQNVKFESTLKAKKAMRLLVIVDNSGQTPALRLSFAEVRLQIGNDLLSTPPNTNEEYVISSRHPIGKGYSIEFSIKDVGRMMAKQNPAIFKIKGAIRYTDVFDDWHETKYCSFYDAKESSFRFCPRGNDVR